MYYEISRLFISKMSDLANLDLESVEALLEVVKALKMTFKGTKHVKKEDRKKDDSRSKKKK